MEKVFDEIIAYQEQRLLDLASTLVPYVTSDDIMQPFDFPELEESSLFRYEEGYLHGLKAARVAVFAALKSASV